MIVLAEVRDDHRLLLRSFLIFNFDFVSLRRCLSVLGGLNSLVLRPEAFDLLYFDFDGGRQYPLPL
jgi:hypothetical protein